MICRENLALLALLAAVAGTMLLFAFAQGIEARQAKISEIGEGMEGVLVKVNVRIESMSVRKGIAFMELYDGTGKINAVLFNAEKTGTLPKKGGFAGIEGKVQKYNGSLEIIVEKVEEWPA
ncbi:MAG: OB-fold nucleic acid binding domain-containing protein [archaeon]